MMLRVVMMRVPPSRPGELAVRSSAALEFEVVSGWVTDEDGVVLRSVLGPQPRLVEDLGAGRGGELVATSDGSLVLDREREVGLATTGVGRQGEEQLGRLAR
jgi:hypothetical protein